MTGNLRLASSLCQGRTRKKKTIMSPFSEDLSKQFPRCLFFFFFQILTKYMNVTCLSISEGLRRQSTVMAQGAKKDRVKESCHCIRILISFFSHSVVTVQWARPAAHAGKYLLDMDASFIM